MEGHSLAVGELVCLAVWCVSVGEKEITVLLLDISRQYRPIIEWMQHGCLYALPLRFKDMKPWQFCKWFGHNICLLANDSEKGHCLLLAHYIEYIAVVFLILFTHFNDEMKACVAKERQYRSLSVQ